MTHNVEKISVDELISQTRRAGAVAARLIDSPERGGRPQVQFTVPVNYFLYPVMLHSMQVR